MLPSRIHRFTASEILRQLTQDGGFLCARYADPPPKRMLDLQMRPVVFRLAMNAGGAGGCGILGSQAPWILDSGWSLAIQIRAPTSPLVTALNTLKQQ